MREVLTRTGIHAGNVRILQLVRRHHGQLRRPPVGAGQIYDTPEITRRREEPQPVDRVVDGPPREAGVRSGSAGADKTLITVEATAERLYQRLGQSRDSAALTPVIQRNWAN
jgi:hypothetical protein